MPDSLFHSPTRFIEIFTQHLQDLLNHQQLGVFILVLANASTHQQLFESLKPALKSRFEAWSRRLSTDNQSRWTDDDLHVFQQLQRIGFDNLQLSQHKTLQHWQLQFNQLRSYRPARNSSSIVTRLFQGFDEQGFHFNKPFLRDEILWQGKIAGHQLRLLYNKFPFADFHGIAVIDPELNKPQHLQQKDCQQMQDIIETLATLQGLGFAYNSLGAFASVNHQHWQTFLSSNPYPVEQDYWLHNGGSHSYPLDVQVFKNLTDAWPAIDSYQHDNQAFNLFGRENRIYLIHRKMQGSYRHSRWTSGFAWSEVMGKFNAGQYTDYQGLQEQDMLQELALLTLNPKP